MREKIKLNKKTKQALRIFTKNLYFLLPNQIESLKIFGSYARGNMKLNSDLDVLVVLKDKNLNLENKVIVAACESLLKTGVDISPIIYSKNEFAYLSRLPSTFLQIVEREAIELNDLLKSQKFKKRD